MRADEVPTRDVNCTQMNLTRSLKDGGLGLGASQAQEHATKADGGRIFMSHRLTCLYSPHHPIIVVFG